MRALFLALILSAPSLTHAAPSRVVAVAASSASAQEEPAATAQWEAVLRTRRAANIEALRAYAQGSLFPRNRSTPGLVNLFLDDAGRPCAMAHLMQASGHAELVRRTALTQNHVRLGEVTEGPLLEWMLTSGLTQEEAALVQEPDMYIGDIADPRIELQLARAEDERLRAHFLAAAAQLEARTDQSLEVAMSRLGGRVLSAPPAW